MTKLKDILGELMPVKKDVTTIIEDNYIRVSMSKMGHNSCVDHLEKITLEVDEEKLDKLLFKENYPFYNKRQSKLIASSLPTILIAKKES